MDENEEGANALPSARIDRIVRYCSHQMTEEEAAEVEREAGADVEFAEQLRRMSTITDALSHFAVTQAATPVNWSAVAWSERLDRAVAALRAGGNAVRTAAEHQIGAALQVALKASATSLTMLPDLASFTTAMTCTHVPASPSPIGLRGGGSGEARDSRAFALLTGGAYQHAQVVVNAGSRAITVSFDDGPTPAEVILISDDPDGRILRAPVTASADGYEAVLRVHDDGQYLLVIP